MEAATKGTTRLRQAFTAADILARINRRHLEVASADRQLPSWPESARGVPNSMLRSALFGAIKRGKRRYMEREPIACRRGVSIFYTGLRLDQPDLDVWAGVLHLARLERPGNRIEFSERKLLRLIGRGGPTGHNIGKSDREWLRKVLARLNGAVVDVVQEPYGYHGRLIDEVFPSNGGGRWAVVLDPQIRVLFNAETWTAIDWAVRRVLIGHPLAQWLHGFYSTDAAPLAYRVETLHRLCGSEAGANAKTDVERKKALHDWVGDSLQPALEAVQRACGPAGQSFLFDIRGDGLVNVIRTPSGSQQRHLRRRASSARNIDDTRGDRTRPQGGIEPDARG